MSDYSNPEYELRWPRGLFTEEAARVSGADSVLILIEDAFVNSAELTDSYWRVEPGVLEALVEHVDEMPERSRTRPYWSQRSTGREHDTLTG